MIAPFTVGMDAARRVKITGNVVESLPLRLEIILRAVELGDRAVLVAREAEAVELDLDTAAVEIGGLQAARVRGERRDAQGQPVLSTKKMASIASRFDTGGRPPPNG